MRRRKFIADFTKFSVVTAVTGAAATTAVNLRSVADDTRHGLTGQVDKLKQRMDSLESGQKNLVRAFCLVTALSTGLDLTLLV